MLDLHAANEAPFPSSKTDNMSGTSSMNNSPLPSATPSPTLHSPSAKGGLPSTAQLDGLRRRGDKSKQDPLRSEPGSSMNETYGGEQYVWVSKRQRISRAERAKYDAEGELPSSGGILKLTSSVDEGGSVCGAGLPRDDPDPFIVRIHRGHVVWVEMSSLKYNSSTI